MLHWRKGAGSPFLYVLRVSAALEAAGYHDWLLAVITQNDDLAVGGGEAALIL